MPQIWGEFNLIIFQYSSSSLVGLALCIIADAILKRTQTPKQVKDKDKSNRSKKLKERQSYL
jgi:hypothetical protein